MKLRTKLVALVGLPIILLVAGICIVGRVMVKDSMEDIIKHNLQGATMLAHQVITSNEGETHYTFKDDGLWLNDRTHVSGPEVAQKMTEVTNLTDLTLFMTVGDTVAAISDPDTQEVVGTVMAPEYIGQVLAGQELYLEDYDVGGGHRYYMYLIPFYETGAPEPFGVIGIAQSNEAVNADVNSIVFRVLALSIPYAIIIVIIASLLIHNLTIKPLRRGLDALERLADGNMDIMFSERDLSMGDEIGELTRAVDKLNTKLVDIIKDILILCGRVHSAASTLSKQSDLSASHVSQIDTAVNEIAQGATTQAEETQTTTDSIVSIGDMISTTRAEVDNLNENARTMNDTGDEALVILGQLEEINKKTENAINIIYDQTNTTNESASKIREAINLITDIAEETNLLSLNASIEAARAGEQGRGFAVVAGQIQKLAEQSNESAKKIEDIVASLIEDSSKAVATMDNVKIIIGQQDEKVTLTGDKFRELRVGIDASVSALSTIAENTRNIDETRQSVVDSAQNLTSIAEENAASTEETSAAVSELNEVINDIAKDSAILNEIANDLHDQVCFFRLPSDIRATINIK